MKFNFSRSQQPRHLSHNTFIHSRPTPSLSIDGSLHISPTHTIRMPAIRHASKRKAPPEGFSDIEDDLLIFSNKMKDAENAPTTSVPRHQVHWPIFQISHQRSRYVYELYYEKEAISKQL